MTDAAERDRTSFQEALALTLSQRDRELVRIAISRLMDHYEKRLEKAAAEVMDFRIEADARAMKTRLLELRTRFEDPTAPRVQLDAFQPPVESQHPESDPPEPDTRPLHLRLADVGYEVDPEDIEALWDDLDRENVAAWLDKLPGVDFEGQEPAPPGVLCGYERVVVDEPDPAE